MRRKTVVLLPEELGAPAWSALRSLHLLLDLLGYGRAGTLDRSPTAVNGEPTQSRANASAAVWRAACWKRRAYAVPGTAIAGKSNTLRCLRASTRLCSARGQPRGAASPTPMPLSAPRVWLAAEDPHRRIPARSSPTWRRRSTRKKHTDRRSPRPQLLLSCPPTASAPYLCLQDPSVAAQPIRYVPALSAPCMLFGEPRSWLAD